MEGREVLGIGRVGNSKNFFGGLRFRFVFSIVATLWIFRLVSVFLVSSGFSVSPCCHIVVVRRVCFRFDSLFLSTMIPERDSRRHPVGSQAAVPGKNGKRQKTPAPSGGIAGSGPWQNWQETPAPSGGTTVPGRHGKRQKTPAPSGGQRSLVAMARDSQRYLVGPRRSLTKMADKRQKEKNIWIQDACGLD